MFSTVSKYVSTTYYYIVKAQKQSYYTAADSSRVLPGLIPFAKVKAQLYGLLHRGAFCQFAFRWIYYYGSNKSTGKETGKTHLCTSVMPLDTKLP